MRRWRGRGAAPADGRPTLGRAAEEAAAAWLERAGLRIRARNVRLAGAEIDIVAEDAATVVFVEVRSRSSRRRGAPMETVGWRKQRQIARAAAAYLARLGRSEAPARFDVVGVDWVEGRPICTHLRSAFESPW